VSESQSQQTLYKLFKVFLVFSVNFVETLDADAASSSRLRLRPELPDSEDCGE
jgi:hypothetical protein